MQSVIDLLAEWLPVLSLYGAHLVLGNVIGGSCCCAVDCDICADDFNRTSGTDIDTGSACGWTESSGSWDIFGNVLRCTSAGLAICDAAHPDTEVHKFVSVDFRHNTSSSSVDVIVALSDASNYYYARYTIGSSTILIRRNNAGSHSTLVTLDTDTTLAINTVYTAKVCCKADLITAYLDGVAWGSVTAVPSGAKSGLAASGSGTAVFDNFELTKAQSGTNPSCAECPDVPQCSDLGGLRDVLLNQLGDQFDITIPAGAYSDPPAGDSPDEVPFCNCTILNGSTYTVTRMNAAALDALTGNNASLFPAAYLDGTNHYFAYVDDNWCENYIGEDGGPGGAGNDCESAPGVDLALVIIFLLACHPTEDYQARINVGVYLVDFAGSDYQTQNALYTDWFYLQTFDPTSFSLTFEDQDNPQQPYNCNACVQNDVTGGLVTPH